MSDDFARLASRRVVLFGGKGGVGKTTLARHAEKIIGESRRTILFAIESLDANALYAKFLEKHLEPFLAIADRGTYLDREELRRFFELSLPGVDELMSWMHIGELAEANPDATIIVDTAPTGHTLRMLSSSQHFRQLALALDAMQEKHRAMVRQFTRRESHDALDAFIEEFDATASRRRAMLLDPAQTAFVPVMLSEPWVVEQTIRLIGELGGIDVPFVVLNRAVLRPDCSLDVARQKRDADARARLAPRRVVDFERRCEVWSAATSVAALPRGSAAYPRAATEVAALQMTFLAGKGGVGKTTCAASLALQLAQERPVTVISVDPAHSLRDVFAHEQPPANLTVEIVDTKAKWQRFRATIGEEIERAIDSLTPRGMSLEHDSEAMRQLIEIAPPGADELFAVTRLADLAASEQTVIVDTAPTGHFLRLLDLPSVAGAWVREFMRILLHYRDLIPAGSLGEELVRASRALKELDETLRSDRASVIVVTRPEPAVVAETLRLIAELERREITLGGVIANYLTPENECVCDRQMRASELAALAPLDVSVTIERRDAPPTSLAELSSIVKR